MKLKNLIETMDIEDSNNLCFKFNIKGESCLLTINNEKYYNKLETESEIVSIVKYSEVIEKDLEEVKAFHGEDFKNFFYEEIEELLDEEITNIEFTRKHEYLEFKFRIEEVFNLIKRKIKEGIK